MQYCSLQHAGSKHVRKHNIFEEKKTENPENAHNTPKRLARCRAAFEFQCFRNCTLSSLYLFTHWGDTYETCRLFKCSKTTEHSAEHISPAQSRDERECLFFQYPIPSHYQWFIPIPDPRFSLVLFPFPSHFHWLFPFPPADAPIPMQVDTFCQSTAVLLLIIFCVAEILKVEDTALLSWCAMTVECVTVCRSSRRSSM